jgi:hypothetical protein
VRAVSWRYGSCPHSQSRELLGVKPDFTGPSMPVAPKPDSACKARREPGPGGATGEFCGIFIFPCTFSSHTNTIHLSHSGRWGKLYTTIRILNLTHFDNFLSLPLYETGFNLCPPMSYYYFNSFRRGVGIIAELRSSLPYDQSGIMILSPYQRPKRQT